MPMIIDVPRGWRNRLQVARDPGLLALAGAVLLVCAPVLPGLARLAVLPALLLAPGYALLRLLGQAAGPRSISVAIPLSIVLIICASLVLNISGIRLGALSLGSLLGAVTALFLAGSYGRQMGASPLRQRWRAPPGDQELAPNNLWPDAGDEPPVAGHVADNGHEETAFATGEVDRLADEGEATQGQVAAALDRSGAQSRGVEEVFIRSGLPGKVVGGGSFYERREVRDLLAYLRLIVNPEDEVSLRRVLNVPKRGIGGRTKETVATMARWDRTSFAATLARPSDVPGLSAPVVHAIEAFNDLLAGLRADADAGVPVAGVAEAVLERSGYLAELVASADPRDASRIENLKELVAMAREFDALREHAGPQDPETPASLADFLEQVSLAAGAAQTGGEAHGGG